MEHDQSESLDLENEVLRPYLAEWVSEVRTLAGRGPRHRLLDVGAGTGAATIELALRFADSEVLALDVAEPHLERVREKALALGLAGRVQAQQVDLDAEWPSIDPVDVAWAAMSLHHLRNPDAALDELLALVRPGGVLAVVEMGQPLWLFAGDVDLGAPGLGERVFAAFRAAHAEELPGFGQPWAPRIAAAGFTVLADREVPIEVGPPYPSALPGYARHYVGDLVDAHWLPEDDRRLVQDVFESGALDRLLDAGGLVLRGSRLVTFARRP